MTTTAATGFRFNQSYDDLEQVAEYLPAFRAVLAEIESAGQYRYNDSFRGRVPGIEGPDEATAIYLLQGLDRQRTQDAQVAALLADGYVWIDAAKDRQKFARIVLVPQRQMGGSWSEHADARLVCGVAGRPLAVLPKGARSRGFTIGDRRVLALAATS